jgi:O-antigen/teichoic acid export membrane protein
MSVDHGDLTKLLSSAALVFIGKFFSSFTGLFERVIIGRLLSPSAYGEFSIALAVFTFAATLGAAGFTQGVPRYMARFDDIRDIRGTWLTGLLIAGGLSILIAVILVAGSPILTHRLFELDGALFLLIIFLVAIPARVVLKIGVGAIRGCENTVYKLLAQDICYPVLRVALISGLLFAGVGIIGTGIGYLVALVVSIVLTYYFLHRIFPLIGEFRLHSREITAFSAPLIVSTIMTVLLTRADTIMIGYFRPSAEVGLYNAAYPLAGVLTVVLTAFGYMYLPVASRLDSEEEGSVERVYELTTKWVYVLVFPLFMLLISYPREIISLVFGVQYGDGGMALAILAVGFFTNAAIGRNRETLSALGATKFILVSNVVAFTINFVANLLLIPLYGFVGAAVASAGSFIALNFVVYLFLREQFQITPFNRRSIKTFVALPLVLLPIGFGVRETLDSSIMMVISFGIISTVMTMGIVFIIGGVDEEDIVLIELIENYVDTRIPYIRRFIPDN